MKKAFRLITLFTLAVFVSGTTVSSQDWPQWRGAGRDAKVNGFKAPAAWPAELRQEWKVTVGYGDASPILSGNRIYLNTRQESDEVIICLDATTGKELWLTKYPCIAVSGPAGSHPGPRATPALANGKLVTFGVSGIISCIDAGNGNVLWRRENPSNAVPQFFTGMSPLLIDNLCIIHTGTKDNGEVLALDLNTGAEKWKWAGDGPSYASPDLMTIDGKKHLIVLSEKNLLGFDLADGKLLWKLAAPVQQRFFNCVSPFIDGQTVYLSGQGTGTKAFRIEKTGSDFAVNELWSNPAAGGKWNTPVLKDGYLYGFSDLRRIYCINASTGATAWIDNTVLSDFAAILDCGSVLIGLPSTGDLIVFKPEPKVFTQIARYKTAPTAVYSYPLIAGNKVYVKDAESLIRYSID